METVFIPRASVLMKDVEIFSNLSKFSAVTGYVPTTHATDCDTNSIKHGNRFGNFLRTLRNSILRRTQTDYDIINDDENKHTIFSKGIRSQLTERKKTLVQLIKKHETAMLAIRNARIQCWKSKAKVDKYQLMTETQKSALRYNQHEQKVRTAALKDTEKVLDKWLKTHERDHISFENKFMEEMKYREKIQKISTEIESDVLGKLDQAIRTMMIKNKQNISDKDISNFSHQLYSGTCRTYKFALTENIPCKTEWIEKPEYENSRLNGKDIAKKIKERFLQDNYTTD